MVFTNRFDITCSECWAIVCSEYQPFKTSGGQPRGREEKTMPNITTDERVEALDRAVRVALAQGGVESDAKIVESVREKLT